MLSQPFWLTKLEMLEQHYTKSKTGTKVESRLSYREVELYSQEHDLLEVLYMLNNTWYCSDWLQLRCKKAAEATQVDIKLHGGG